MHRLAPLFAILLLAGCVTYSSVPQRLARLHENMTEQEVFDLLGKPRSSSNMGALIVHEYVFSASQPLALHPHEPPTTSYYVIVGRDGRVRSFGPN